MNQKNMTFLEHLEEFRWTLGKCCLAFFLGLLLVLFLMKDVSLLLQYPLAKAYGSVDLLQQKLITYRPMGVISVYIQVAVLGGFTLAMPFILYFLGGFLTPGLKKDEKKILGPACFFAFILFVLGVLFAFYFVLPIALGFTVKLNQMLSFELLWAATDYYNLVVWFCLATGLFFQFPLIIVILVLLKIVSLRVLRKYRALVFIGLMIFSALISPGGDFVSLPITTILMYSLYEFSILIGSHIDRKRLKKEMDSFNDI